MTKLRNDPPQAGRTFKVRLGGISQDYVVAIDDDLKAERALREILHPGVEHDAGYSIDMVPIALSHSSMMGLGLKLNEVRQLL